ncbi:MAG: maleylpyruvate isomerase family mycothiol-dependent enzyme [Propionibacteriaceae bacterium]|jgi:maleylpyruvate isomerase|nr:maleylpyruvate isomerase family mycothiol-dependent enzyme [Propionibacteriaceae bacterium]
MGRPWAEIPIEQMRVWLQNATQRLLGDSIGLTEDQWRAPAKLPGWSRAHVAAHLTRDARIFREILLIPELAWTADDPHSLPEIEEGADQPALRLQEELDQTAAQFSAAVAEVPSWSRPVQIAAGVYPLSLITLVRLHELLIHHLDLDVGFTPDPIAPEAASWLLEFALFHMRGYAGPAIQVSSASGIRAVVGRGEPLPVGGTDARLWAWLCGRIGPEWVEGAYGLALPLLP